MRTILTTLCFALILISCKISEKLPKADQTIQIMHRANDYFMKKWPDVGEIIVTNQPRASNIWTRAVYYEGLMDFYGITGDPRLYKYAEDWATFHKWNLRDGKTFTRNADNQCAGQVYIDLYHLDPAPHKIKFIRESIDSMMNTNKIDDWTWVDAIQMGMPIFAQLGVNYDEPKYFKRMYEMYADIKYRQGEHGLYNPVDHLWWRDADFDPPYKEPNGEDCYWSRGNGWVLVALTRVLKTIPANEEHRKDYEKDLIDMCNALLKVQRPDGFWNVSLHDPSNFGGKETSGTAMFVYGMAWGMNNGYLNKKTFMEPTLKAWNAMCKDAVHANGFLGYVQGTGKEPSAGQPLSYDKTPDFEDYGLGAFLMAGSEIFKIKN